MYCITEETAVITLGLRTQNSGLEPENYGKNQEVLLESTEKDMGVLGGIYNKANGTSTHTVKTPLINK